MQGPTVRLTLALGSLMLCGACAEDEVTPREPARDFEPLVLREDWSPVARDADPFVTELDEAPVCDGPEFSIEEQWLELDTGLCNWVTLEAAARSAVEVGQRVRLVVSHFDLNAPSPTEGVVELTLGGCETWSKIVPIPSAAAVYTEVIASPCFVAAGDFVHFHLHNHGQNNWQLQELSVER